MKLRPQKFLPILIILGAGYARPATGHGGRFMHNGGHTEPIPSDLTTTESEGPHTSGSNGFLSPSYPDDKPKEDKDKDKDKKNSNVSTATEKSINTEEQNVEVKPASSAAGEEQKAPASEQEEDPGSVLSFNFLHYMIQKFKFSDMAR